MKIIIVSGYFNPLHLGHIKLFKAAKKLGDKLIVIVNNDKQQLIKKGRIIMNEVERFTIIDSIKYVNKVFLAEDYDPTVNKTLEMIGKKYSKDNLVFVNGGNDRTNISEIPEINVCNLYNINILFGIGGFNKTNSSTNINKLIENS